jgi:hypothetical protein
MVVSVAAFTTSLVDQIAAAESNALAALGSGAAASAAPFRFNP